MAALTRSDAARAREVLDDIGEGYRALGLGPDLYLNLMSSLVLVEKRRWFEARAILDAIDPATLEAPEDLRTFEHAMVRLASVTHVYR